MTHFLVGMISVLVIVKSGVIRTQLSANEFAAVDNKNKRSTANGVFIPSPCAQPRAALSCIFSLIMFSGVKPAGWEIQPMRRTVQSYGEIRFDSGPADEIGWWQLADARMKTTLRQLLNTL
jgi:hypothetical protein